MTAIETVPSTSMNRQAAKAVALNAHDHDEARLFLDMLGIVDGPRGREILPDETGGIHVPPMGKGPGAQADPPSRAREPEEPAARNVTTPAGLRVLPPASSQAPVTARATSKAPARAPKPAGTRQPKPIEHGTYRGYQMHGRRNEPISPDDPCGCRAAGTAYFKARDAKKHSDPAPTESARALIVVPDSTPEPVATTSPETKPRNKGGRKPEPIRHGTSGGFQTHKRRKEPIPDDDACGCRAARRKDKADRARVSRARKSGRIVDQPPVVTTPPSPSPLAVDLREQIDTASRSPRAAVRRRAARALDLLQDLHDALDDLTRAQRGGRS